MKRNFKFFIILLVGSFVTVANVQNTQEQTQKNLEPSAYAMNRFAKALRAMRKKCSNNSNAPICSVFSSDDEIQNDIDTATVVTIGHNLEKSEGVTPLAEKIEKRLKHNVNLVEQSLAGDKKSCRSFESKLRFATLRSAGLWLVLRNRPLCEAAAFAATARCLNNCREKPEKR